MNHRISKNAIFIIVVAILYCITVNQPVKNIDGGTPFGCNTEDIANMYTDYIEEWKEGIKIAFDESEKQVIDIKPKPDDDVVGPDPDPKKCICGGSGWIIQGDGHKTPCPFHGKKETIIYKPLLDLE